ncbi:MAG: restriction endonuclease subunit S [Candidatus Bipolaricaulota bacterium]
MSTTRSAVPPLPPAETGLPEGWARSLARDVLDVRYGKGLPERDRRSGPYAVYGSNGVVGHHDEPLTAGPAVILGRKGTVGTVHLSRQPCWPIDTTYFVEEAPGLDIGFLYYALSTMGLPGMDTSSAIPGLSREDVFAQALLLAPLPEQKRIVAKVEELLEQADAARARVARVSAILRRFRQCILAAACSGRLTETWRHSHRTPEAAGDLIDRIAASRPAGARVFVCDVPKAEEMPDGWARTTIGFLAEPTLNGRPYVTSGSRGWARYVSDRGPYFVRSENINTDVLRIEEAVRVTAPAGAEADRTRVCDADLLLTITGNNVGRTAVVPAGVPAAHVSQHVAIIRTTRLSDVRYLWLWLRSSNHGQGQLGEHFYGETKPGLNLDQVKSVWVDLPPVSEQREIVHRVQVLFTLADEIETHVRAATGRAARLPQAILARAFRGELVTTEADLAAREGRDYEPASVLLERIGEARKQHKPGKRGRGGKNMAKRSTGRLPATRRRPLDEVLREQGEPLTPERLFDLAGFDAGSVDDFYEQLRELVQDGKVRENRPDKENVTLEAVGI